jgi:hypothetical protein
MEIKQYREVYNDGATEVERNVISRVVIDGFYFCSALEDTVRPDGVKIAKMTAIPALKYNVTVTMSARFKRLMVLLYNQNDYTINHKGVTFAGVRAHGGNTALNTEGCILVAFNTDNKKIWGTAEKALLEKVQEAIARKEAVTWEIINAFHVV